MCPDILNIDLQLPIGKGESDGLSCLIRPFQKLLRKGAPAGNINYLFYQHVNNVSYNLGSICYSEGQRIIFFPGFRARDLLWQLDSKGDLSTYTLSDFVVDHFTLDRDFKKMHLALVKKLKIDEKKYPVTFKTFKLDGNIFFLFGLSIQSPLLLEATPRRISISVPTPASDAKRRMKEIIDAREGAIFQIVKQAGNRTFSSDEFIHFNFFICPSDVDIPKEHVSLSLPIKEPIVVNSHSGKRIPYRLHYVTLIGTDKKIAVAVSRHFGKLINEILIGHVKRL
jgi:hypothetical protein